MALRGLGWGLDAVGMGTGSGKGVVYDAGQLAGDHGMPVDTGELPASLGTKHHQKVETCALVLRWLRVAVHVSPAASHCGFCQASPETPSRPDALGKTWLVHECLQTS